MSEKKELLQKGLELATPLIYQWVLPKVKDLLNSSTTKLSINTKEIKHDYYKNQFEDYLSNRYSKFFILETLVFPNYPTSFDDLYYPLTVNGLDGIDGLAEKEFVIDSFRDDFLPDYKRILIQDDAGMGKSTILRKLFLSCIRENKGIPVLVELRKLNKSNLLLDEIISQFSTLRKDADKELLLKLIERGDFVFLFDGLDEIPLKNREDVVSNILKFIEKSGNNLYLISSRSESITSSFKEFQQFTVNNLKQEETFQLFRNYDKYSFEKIADDLIKLLSSKELENVRHFLKNPFLASLVYKTFSHKRDIPKQKEQFYRKVYDALYEDHDLSKEGYYKRDKYCGLGIDDFESVLRCIGYKTMRLEKVELSKTEFLEIINGAKRFCIGLNFSASDFLKDLTNTVTLFRLEGLNYKWIHKSYRDYFATRFIIYDSGSKIDDTIRQLFEEEALNINVLDFLSSMAPKKFKHIVVKSAIDEFIKKYEHISSGLDNIINEQLLKNYINFYIDYSLFIGYFHKKGDSDRQYYNAFREYSEERSLSINHLTLVSTNDEKKVNSTIIIKNKEQEELHNLLKLRFPLLFVKSTHTKLDTEFVNLKDKTWTFLDKFYFKTYFGEYSVKELSKDFSNGYRQETLDLLRFSIDFLFDSISVFEYTKCVEMKAEIDKELQSENKAVDFF